MGSFETSGRPWDLVAQVASSQDGVATRRQMLASGLEPAQIRRRVTSGRWQRLLRGVYLTQSGTVTDGQRRTAALLAAGSDSQLTSRTALVMHGVRYLPPDDGLVHVLLPVERKLTSHGFVTVHRTRALPRPRHLQGQPVSPADVAALLLCRQVSSLRDARALLSEVVQRRLTTVPRLGLLVEQGPRNYSGVARRVVRELEAGCRSAPEMEFRELVLTSPVLRQGVQFNLAVAVGGRTFIADACWFELRLIVEIDSIEHHGIGDGPERTARRRSALMADGWTVVSVSPRRVRKDGITVLRELEVIAARAMR